MNIAISRTFCAVALVTLAACASPPRAEKYVAMPQGSTWTSQLRNTGSYNPGPAETTGKITTVMYKGQPHTGFQSGPNTFVTLPTGDWMALLGGDGKPLLTWDPPVGFNFPLEVGKQWSRSYKFTNHGTNMSMDVVSQATVEAYEEVSVPAGTFKTFRIHTVSNAGADETFWFSPEHGIFVKQLLKRTEKSPSGPGSREIELKSISVAK
jgi:hypothetical protein